MSPILSTFSLGSRPSTIIDSLEFFDVGTSINSATVAYPAGIQADDIAIFVQTSWTASGFSPAAPADVIPSGYTSAGTGAVNGGFFNYGGWRTSWTYKRLTGGESGSITGMDSNNDRKVLTIFRPAGFYKTATIANGSADSVGQFAASGTDPAAVVLAVNGKAKPIMLLFSWCSAAAVTSDTVSPYSYDEYATTDGYLILGTSLHEGSGTLASDATADMNSHSTAGNIHFHTYLQFS